MIARNWFGTRELLQNRTMPNIAALLKAEISRVARKEIKTQTDGLHAAARSLRQEIAALKRRVQDLERELRRNGKSIEKLAPPADSQTEASAGARLTSKGLASLRKRLGLSAADFGRLVGASGLSIYKWEQGKAKPRARFLEALIEVRGLGKKEARKRLEQAV